MNESLKIKGESAHIHLFPFCPFLKLLYISDVIF